VSQLGIVLRVGDDDAKKLGDGFESFDAKSLTRLEKFHAIVRVEQNDCDFNLALRKPEPSDGGNEQTAAIIAASRVKYATPRAEVEAMLLANLRPDVSKTKPPDPPDSDESPGGKPVPKPTSPAGTPVEPVPPVPPAVTAMPALPSLVMPKVSEPPQPAEPPKAAEIPKAAVPPTTEILKPTVSEKNRGRKRSQRKPPSRKIWDVGSHCTSPFRNG
jgi:hypothetical protein